MHTDIHTCIHTYIHTYIHTCIHTYIHTYTHIYITYIHREREREKDDLHEVAEGELPRLALRPLDHAGHLEASSSGSSLLHWNCSLAFSLLPVDHHFSTGCSPELSLAFSNGC